MSEKITAKKSLGQNFLTTSAVAAKIAEAGNLSPQDTVIEIGPGKGILTRELLTRAGRVIAIEKDHRLLSTLQETFQKEIQEGSLQLIEDDALLFAPERYELSDYKVIANIPYYITGLLFKTFLSLQTQPDTMVVLVQKEVAQRIVARDHKESILSLSVKAYGTPRYIETVKAGNFSPKPSVDSAILAIEHISRQHFSNSREEQRFFELIKTGFAQKRKLLLRNLAPLITNDQAFFCGIAEKVRAENVPLDKWLCLAKNA